MNSNLLKILDSFLRQSLRAWRALFNDTLRPKIGLVAEKLLKFYI